VGGSLVALLLAEAGMRAAGYAPERYRSRYRLTNRGDLKIRSEARVLDCYPSNPRGYFDIDLRGAKVREAYAARGIQGIDAVAGEFPFAVEFDYNERGFRDRAFGPKTEGVTRVAVVGDSFTEGQGVRESDAYPRVLERLLNARRRRHFEVLNLGHRGLDLPELLGPFEAALALGADVVVYGMVLNDADQSHVFRRRWPRLNDWIMVRRPSVQLGPLDSRLVALVRDRYETRVTARETTRWYQEMYGEPNRDGWDRTKAHLRRMQARARERGVPLLVALWPLLVELEGAYPFQDAHRRIAQVCQRNGIDFLDLFDALRGRRSAALWVHPVDLHPNEVGHRLAAEALAPVVAALAR
jgi:lysophospholipase L1-like esterase